MGRIVTLLDVLTVAWAVLMLLALVVIDWRRRERRRRADEWWNAQLAVAVDRAKRKARTRPKADAHVQRRRYAR